MPGYSGNQILSPNIEIIQDWTFKTTNFFSFPSIQVRSLISYSKIRRVIREYTYELPCSLKEVISQAIESYNIYLMPMTFDILVKD